MTEVNKTRIETLLLDSTTAPNLLEDVASSDAHLLEAVKSAEELFSRLVRLENQPEQKEAIKSELADDTVRDLFERQVTHQKVDGALSVIKSNLGKLAGAAEKRIYSGFFGLIKRLFNLIGLYNPEAVVKLQSLASRDITVIKHSS
jgi:hypothetical protein